MYRSLSIIMVAVFVALPGCARNDNSGGTGARASTFDHVQSTGVLRVGYFVYEPCTMIEPKSGKVYGLFVDMIEQIAKELKWKVEYKQVDLKNFAAGLQNGEFDLSIGATFSSPGRATGVAFTRPVFYLGYSGVAPADQASRYKSWEDLDRPGMRVAVKQGSAIGDYVTRHFTTATIVALEEPALSAPLAAVPAQADVGLMNQITVYSYLRDNPKKQVREILADRPLEFTGICWAVRPDDPRWLEFINTCLKYLEDTGRTQEWEKKYGIPYLYHERRTMKYATEEKSGEVQLW